jgi:hypothetical protein
VSTRTYTRRPLIASVFSRAPPAHCATAWRKNDSDAERYWLHSSAVRRAIVGAVVLALVVATALIVPVANAHIRKCGFVTARNGGHTSTIHARHVGCPTARLVTRHVVNRPIGRVCPIGGKPCYVRANGSRYTCRTYERGAFVTRCHAGRKYVSFAED